ncbi:DUF2971 domain-containing protein [Arthrobacter sp. STN4]|uniref:DUF2971 domain-containing protein n=1 Tax=Arthrobacter sp. STN4 TaxID=2923276 RepID=UPI00211A8A94|nr:DUF2971 domain-containing protein [Arthrobacter sp. STN4]MCQ9162962.1 DUF2971 domain-containing protein [Arthrobacter sp. STN4]
MRDDTEDKPEPKTEPGKSAPEREEANKALEGREKEPPSLSSQVALSRELTPEVLAQFRSMVSQPWMRADAASSIAHSVLAFQAAPALRDFQKTIRDIAALSPPATSAWSITQMAAAGAALPSGLRDALRNVGESVDRSVLSSLTPSAASIAAMVAVLTSAARGALLPDFATKTQAFLTTDKQLRYRRNWPVWHYTNGHALLSILETGQLWASNPQNLNDASEMTHGFGVIRDAFAEQAALSKSSARSGSDNWASLEKVLSSVLDKTFVDSIITDVYYISASMERDSLTLWRNYADGDGFAIGIDASVELSADGLYVDADDDDSHLREDIPLISGWYRVTYKMPDKQKLAQAFIQSAIEDVKNTAAKDRSALVSELRKQAVILASVMKHEAFKDEREVRWISTNYTTFDPVHYEHGRKSIVAVLHAMTSSAEGDRPLPIKGLWCSPIPDDGILRTMQGLLRQRGYEPASRNVNKSKQPFRG